MNSTTFINNNCMLYLLYFGFWITLFSKHFSIVPNKTIKLYIWQYFYKKSELTILYTQTYMYPIFLHCAWYLQFSKEIGSIWMELILLVFFGMRKNKVGEVWSVLLYILNNLLCILNNIKKISISLENGFPFNASWITK